MPGPLTFHELHDPAEIARRARARDYQQPLEPFTARAADRLYDTCRAMIFAGRIDARSPVGDAVLDYHDTRWPDGDPADTRDDTV